jgi:hypothetical protein
MENDKTNENSELKAASDKRKADIDAEIMALFEKIKTKIKPATIDTANHQMSTGEFYTMLQEHYPEAEYLSLSELYDLLKDSGYKYELINGSFVWLVKKN